MSIDYDRLRELLRIAGGGRSVRDYATEYDAERELENLAPDMARELLRLRDWLDDLLNVMAYDCTALDKDNYPLTKNYLATYADRLTVLLEGDTE